VSNMAFRGVYADWKLVKTRGVVQVVLELPIEDADAAYEVLGGMPVAAKERWFAVAAIRTQPEETPISPAVATPQPVPDKPQAGGKRDWRELPPAQQAALRCNNPVFIAFLKEERTFDMSEATCDPAECIRLICGVASRSELNTNQKARVIWHQLDSQFQAWNAVERVGA
jgi:hypothetical protein